MNEQLEQLFKWLEELSLLEKRIPEQRDYIQEKQVVLDEIRIFNKAMGLSMWYNQEKQQRLEEIIDSAQGIYENLKERRHNLILSIHGTR